MAGIVGSVLPRFCVVGETVNLTARMMFCSSGKRVYMEYILKIIIMFCGNYFHIINRLIDKNYQNIYLPLPIRYSVSNSKG